ncbi:hypothetical protein Cni_G03428 [Canna indica]|uniref:Acyl carrier protein n=1 Tax=Canna indica TaxID=4628 RepID=A0AAQ3JSF7_9LILI|nr:hypothetical protein Cni_G03428 [Canna indica]
MASLARTTISFSARPAQSLKVTKEFFGSKTVSFSTRKSFSAGRLRSDPSRFQINCAAKAETLEKVVKIVKEQLALPEDAAITGESKFVDLGADSLDTVEIVMGLEEAFCISVEEENAQSIVTVQDAADLIEKLCEEK